MIVKIKLKIKDASSGMSDKSLASPIIYKTEAHITGIKWNFEIPSNNGFMFCSSLNK